MKPLTNNGFTLIELMIVIAIIGTLTGIATPNYINYRQRAIQAKTISEFKMIEREIIAFQLENEDGFLPVTLADIGLDTLSDHWGNPYQYLPIQGVSKKDLKTGLLRKDHFMVPVNTDFDLYSMGPDGKSVAPFTAKASRDDIVRANNGQYMGLASEY